jgi:hypothetical protein
MVRNTCLINLLLLTISLVTFNDVIEFTKPKKYSLVPYRRYWGQALSKSPSKFHCVVHGQLISDTLQLRIHSGSFESKPIFKVIAAFPLLRRVIQVRG